MLLRREGRFSDFRRDLKKRDCIERRREKKRVQICPTLPKQKCRARTHHSIRHIVVNFQRYSLLRVWANPRVPGGKSNIDFQVQNKERKEDFSLSLSPHLFLSLSLCGWIGFLVGGFFPTGGMRNFKQGKRGEERGEQTSSHTAILLLLLLSEQDFFPS